MLYYVNRKEDNMTINDRFKLVRKELGLSQETFGSRIGITNSAVSKIEKGENKVTESLIKLLRSEYKVDPFWLETGIGDDKFTAIPDTIIDALVDEYKLDDYDRFIIEAYVEAPPEQQKAIKDFLLTLAEKAKKKSGE
jgi:transcriptional regulator with XRE-family HTH domain